MTIISTAARILVSGIVVVGNCIPQAEVNSLPGLNFKPNFKHYSGYLRASERNYIHYWFMEAESNPAVNPLAIWLSGGPGASSVSAVLAEGGPFHLNDDGRTITRNPHTWNKNASILFLESPAGVGFSYSTDFNVTTDDDETSLTNYNALKQFYEHFPRYRRNNLYVTGGSYAGKYIPTLVSRILDGMEKFAVNLKGFAIENGAMNDQMQSDAAISFAYSRGFVDETLWIRIREKCCPSSCATQCEFSKSESSFCKSAVANISRSVMFAGLHPFDVYRDCNLDWRGSKVPLGSRRSSKRSEHITIASMGAAEEGQPPPHVDQYGGFNQPCLESATSERYMNQESVRRALYIPTSTHSWAAETAAVGAAYKQLYADMRPFILKAVAARLRVLLYFGDTDSVCSHLLGERFAGSLGLPRKHAKRAWRMDDLQIGGFVTEFVGGFQLMTVRGAGHNVAQWKPAAAEHLITKFFNNFPY